MEISKKKRLIKAAIQIFAAALLVTADQLLKRAAVLGLKGKEGIVLIKNFIGLTYAENTGAAFSILSKHTQLLSLITVVIILAAVAYLFFGKIESRLAEVCGVVIVAGGVGNLIDRLSMGYVVDYIETLFMDFPIFNLADIFVTCGVAVLCVYLIYDMIRDEVNKRKNTEAQGE